MKPQGEGGGGLGEDSTRCTLLCEFVQTLQTIDHARHILAIGSRVGGIHWGPHVVRLAG